MPTKPKIAGYTRISVDIEQDRDNTSIENQKSIIKDYVSRVFPGSELDLYEDRDRSGYTFEQREGYMELRPKLIGLEYDILIVKDFSRFSRRNSKGLVELEDIRDNGVRIISIGDNIDYPTQDDWQRIQMLFLFNELPVTDASRKVKSVIQCRQEEGRWICAVPYGYIMTNSKAMKFEVSEPEADVVREIFRLYNEGWGYKKIAGHLTEQHIPTPRMAEKARKEAAGEECRLKARPEWSIQTISEILTNDFYIGTLRQRKYKRKKINGADEKLLKTDNLVFENNHEPIIEPLVFAQVQEALKMRSGNGYNGVKKYETSYSGYLFCGDCGAPMFSMSRPNLAPAYRCGTYHRYGTGKCSSHHTRVDMLDLILKEYIKKVRDNSQAMIEQLQTAIASEQEETKASKNVLETLELQIEDAKAEIKALTRQKTRDLMKHPERTDILEEAYDEQIDDLTIRIEGLKNQMKLSADKHNAVIQVNRTAKTIFEVFDNILAKERLSKQDIGLIIDKIKIYTGRIEVYLKADIDELLKITSEPYIADCKGNAVNFKLGTKHIVTSHIAGVKGSKGGELSVNTVSDGEPLWIYTDQHLSRFGIISFFFHSGTFPSYNNAIDRKSFISKITHSMLNTRSNHIIIRYVLLHNQPHTFHIVLSIAPITQGIQVAKFKVILKTFSNTACSKSDFPGNKTLSPSLTFMIKQDTIYSKHSVGFSIFFCNPKSVLLSHSIIIINAS